MKRLLYFAYGSNMCSRRMSMRINREVTAERTHRLYGWKLVFDCGYKANSYANIIRGERTDFVEGALYALTQKEVSALNMFECYPHNYEQRFFDLPNGELGYAYVSVRESFKTKALPDGHYLETMIRGALANGLMHTHRLLTSYKQRHGYPDVPLVRVATFSSTKKGKKKKNRTNEVYHR